MSDVGYQMLVLLEVVVGCFTSWCASINAASGVHQHTPDVGVYARWCLCAMLVALNGGVTLDCGLVDCG